MATAWAILSLAFLAVAQADATLVLAGILIARGDVTFPTAFIGCLIGTFAGDMLMIAIGRSLGWAALDRKLARLLTGEGTLPRWTRWVERHGPSAAFLSRFMPGMSMGIHWLLGLVCQRIWRLVPALFAAGVLYVLIVLWASSAVARESQRILGESSPWSTWGMVGAGVGLYASYRLVTWILTRVVTQASTSPEV